MNHSIEKIFRTCSGKLLVLSMAAVALVFILAPAAKAQDFILHPGWISGTVTLADPLQPGGKHTIWRLSVNAHGTNPATGQVYSASFAADNTDQFTLPVEAGTWPYFVDVSVNFGPKTQFAGGGSANFNRNNITVVEGQTVTLNLQTDAWIYVTESVAGETVRNLQTTINSRQNNGSSPQYGFNISATAAGASIRLPVVAGSAAYEVQSNASVMTDGRDSFGLLCAPLMVSVPNPDDQASAPFFLQPGYVQGAVIANGAAIYDGYIQALWNAGNGDTYWSTTTFDAAGSFSFPVYPGSNVSVRGRVCTSRWDCVSLPEKIINVPAGGTATCNWEIALGGTISGQVEIIGVPLYSFRVTATNPNGTRQATVTGGNSYTLNAFPGQWQVEISAAPAQENSIPDIIHGHQYTFAKQTVEVPAGGNATANFTLIPGFIVGSALSENSAAIAELQEVTVEMRSEPLEPRKTAVSQHKDNNLADANHVNFYHTSVEPGDWLITGTTMGFKHAFPEGYSGASTLRVSEYNDKTKIWNIPLLPVNQSQTTEYNLNYLTAQVYARLRIADGGLLSTPAVGGSNQPNAAGIKERAVTVSGNSPATNVTEGRVMLYAIPGTYKLTAAAYVAGASTTFGQLTVTVEPGDVVLIDPDAPDLKWTSPPGDYQTCSSCVTVAGTVTDQSGLASLMVSVNGELPYSVQVAADGSFSIQVCGLRNDSANPNVIRLIAKDTYGNTVQIDRTTRCTNRAPVAMPDSYSLDEDGTLVMAAPGLVGNDTDADGNPLTAVLVSGPAHGVLVLNADGSFGYSPNANYNGPDAFTYKANDGKADSEPVTVTLNIRPINDRPFAAAQDASTNEDTAVTLTLAGNDVDGDPLTFVATTNPAHGTLTISGSRCTYTPAKDYFGTDSFSIAANDGQVDSVPATVTITVGAINDDPVAVGDSPTIKEDSGAKVIDVLGNDSMGPDTGETLTITSVTQGAHGVVTIIDGGAKLTYLPALDFFGADEFTYTINDGNGGSATATVHVTVENVNDPPSATAQVVSTNEDNAVAVYLAGSDKDGDPLTFGVVTNPAHGTLSGSGANLVYTPDKDYFGEDSFSFVANDGKIDSVPAAVTITVAPVNDPPVIQRLALDKNVIQENNSVYLSGSLIDPDPSDSHTVTIIWGDGQSNTLNLAAGVTSYAASHKFLDDNPTATASDIYAISATLADAGGGQDVGSLSLTVNNAAPVIGNVAGPTAPMPVGSPSTVKVDFSDPGAQDTFRVSFDWGDGLKDMVDATAPSAQATHLYSTPGVYVVSILVADDDTGAASTSFQYVVSYDPLGGFVTGGGWIWSPPGAYYPGDPQSSSLEGKANFGFVAKYKNGANTPDGNTEFQFKAGDLNFKSKSYDWLVVAGRSAKYKGIGTINGGGDYAFMLTAIDGDLQGGGGVDRFRIKIWDKATGRIVYDNQLGADDTLEASTALGSGSIVIHK
jgi:hypothetical protein